MTTLEELVEYTKEFGPKEVVSDIRRVKLAEAEEICQILQKENISIMPYDFPLVCGIWKSDSAHEYQLSATKELIKVLASEKGVDYRTKEGFKEILSDLTADNFRKKPINDWDTTLGGMIDCAYGSSPSSAVLDLIDHDDEFSVIKEYGLHEWDFNPVPQNLWTDKKKKPTDTAREATKELIKVLASEKGVDYRTKEGFKEILSDLTRDNFRKKPINDWDTTLGGMIMSAYKSSPSAVLDLIDHDDGFSVIKEYGLSEWDFDKTNCWTKKGKPTDTAREATKELIKVLASEKGVDYRTKEGFKEILSELTTNNFQKKPINDWDTTLGGMIMSAYGNSPSSAVLDLIDHDDEFSVIKEYGLREWDFNGVINLWTDKKKKSTDTAREATKKLIKVLASEKGVDYRTKEGFKEILSELTTNNFQKKPINDWDTTLGGMIMSAYKSSPSSAVLDLIDHDDGFSVIKEYGLREWDFNGVINLWTDKKKKSTDTAREATKELIKVLASEKGVDYRTKEGFKEILSELTEDNFRKKPINDWDTTLGGMIMSAYGNSPSSAVLDLIDHDDEFSVIKEYGLHEWDFNGVINLWTDKKKKSTDTAREATKEFIKVLASEKGVDYRTKEGFKEILSELTANNFRKKPINDWDTTLGGMLNAYGYSPSSAILDLIKHDKDFSRLRKHKKAIKASLDEQYLHLRKNRFEGKYSAQQIRRSLTDHGLDFSDKGFFGFTIGDKNTVREMLADQAYLHFGDQSISYFGLEGPSFGSYFEFAKYLHIDASSSLVVERDQRAYELMNQIKGIKSLDQYLNDSSLRRLEIQNNYAEVSLMETDKQFDLIFLDWLGQLAPTNTRELELAYSKLNSGGMIALTLMDSGVAQSRYQAHFDRDDQQVDFLREWSENNGLYLQHIGYSGGDKVKTEMGLYLIS